jgi:hypothetical protein
MPLVLEGSMIFNTPHLQIMAVTIATLMESGFITKYQDCAIVSSLFISVWKVS